MSDDQPNTEKSSTEKPSTEKSSAETPSTEKPTKPARSPEEQAEMTAALERWSASLAQELGIADLEVDLDAVLALAGVAAHAVLRPAAPLTTYLVGYAAGRAAALDEVSGEQATARAAEVAVALARSVER
jgi:hypothetical protein